MRPPHDLPESSAVRPAAADCDVLVIGGGPAGSTIAALLAGRGHDVVLLEKACHPRFHIGESLLPANAELFDRLGVREAVEAIGLRKWGIEFVAPPAGPLPAGRACVEFGEAWDRRRPYAWQVRRSELDELLFRRAAAQGARTLERQRATRVDFDAEGARVDTRGDDGSTTSWRARFVVDASGRDTLLASQFGCKQKHAAHASAALYGHFRGARRLEGRAAGHISIFWFEHGWCWFIPLADGTTSVGAVCWPYYLKTRAGRPLADFLHATIALCPGLADRLAAAELVEGSVQATGNYSYVSTRSSGERYLLLGDAYAFIDPVFSSGVYLAMQSAFEGAEVVDATLARPREAAAARARFDRRLRLGPREFTWFILRVTNPTLREFLLASRGPFRVKEALVSLLAGDIYGSTPIRGSIRALKALYYLVSLLNLRRTIDAWKRRRLNIRDIEGAVA